MAGRASSLLGVFKLPAERVYGSLSLACARILQMPLHMLLGSTGASELQRLDNAMISEGFRFNLARRDGSLDV